MPVVGKPAPLSREAESIAPDIPCIAFLAKLHSSRANNSHGVPVASLRFSFDCVANYPMLALGSDSTSISINCLS
jgi:hypothetical protein